MKNINKIFKAIYSFHFFVNVFYYKKFTRRKNVNKILKAIYITSKNLLTFFSLQFHFQTSGRGRGNISFLYNLKPTPIIFFQKNKI